MHPNKKRKPKHTSKFRYDNSGHPIKIGSSRRCKAISVNHMRAHGHDFNFKYNGYKSYSKNVWQNIKFAYTAIKPRKRRII